MAQGRIMISVGSRACFTNVQEFYNSLALKA